MQRWVLLCQVPACWLCTRVAMGQCQGAPELLAVPNHPGASHLHLHLPCWMRLQQIKEDTKNKSQQFLDVSLLFASSPPGSSHTLLLQGKHFLLYSYQKKSVLLLSSSTDPSWHHPNESAVKSELCHVTPHCVKDYAIKNTLLCCKSIELLMVLFQNRCMIFFTKLELFVHVTLEGS